MDSCTSLSSNGPVRKLGGQSTGSSDQKVCSPQQDEGNEGSFFLFVGGFEFHSKNVYSIGDVEKKIESRFWTNLSAEHLSNTHL